MQSKEFTTCPSKRKAEKWSLARQRNEKFPVAFSIEISIPLQRRGQKNRLQEREALVKTLNPTILYLKRIVENHRGLMKLYHGIEK